MKTTFAQRLSVLRQEKKISQRQAARDLAISQALMSHYENGAREPGLAFVERACDYYGVTADYLLGRSLSRSGEVILAEQLPSAADEKDNVMRGSAMAMLQKKLIVNSVSMIFDVLGAMRQPELVKAAGKYLGLAYYKLFRMVYAANDELPQNVFAVDPRVYQSIADAEMKKAEAELLTLLADTEQLPDLRFETLGQWFPQHYQSLLTLLNNAGQRSMEAGRK